MNKLKNPDVARIWNEKWDRLNDINRSSVAIVCCDEALDPVKDVVKTFPPNFDQEVNDRNTVLKDFDAYRRRIKTAEAKKTSLVRLAAINENRRILEYEMYIEFLKSQKYMKIVVHACL